MLCFCCVFILWHFAGPGCRSCHYLLTNIICLQVTPDQSIALVEYIAHLSVEDWDMIPYDLAQLGFLPPGNNLPKHLCLHVR